MLPAIELWSHHTVVGPFSFIICAFYFGREGLVGGFPFGKVAFSLGVGLIRLRPKKKLHFLFCRDFGKQLQSSAVKRST
jgi:hypothetical protein